MKKLYWRPQKISNRILIVIACISLIGIIAVEKKLTRKRQPYYEEKMIAAKQTKAAFETIKEARIKKEIFINPSFDPAESGLIGYLSSPVTTNTGHLPAKQTSINPNFAAVVVNYLKKAGVEKGDVVAVGMSSSFPALNIAIIAAIEAIKAKAVIISSIGSSQWGANIPDFMWPDMENILVKEKNFKTRSVAATLGGIDDRALGIGAEGRQLIENAIIRNGIKFLKVKNFKDSLEQRMAIYKEEAGPNSIKAYINVGGGTTSVGTNIGKRAFTPGLNRRLPPGSGEIDSIMSRFSIDGIPVIHLTQIDNIAHNNGLPTQMEKMPSPGYGKIFYKEEYNRWLAGGVLLCVVGMLYIFIRLDWGFRLFPESSSKNPSPPPEQMV